MRLKKKPKKIIFLILILLVLIGSGLLVYKLFFAKDSVAETKVLKKIDKYGYELKSNKTERYKKLFEELNDILTADKVDEELYVKKISEMFIYDFYSLNEKTAKTDVGGVDFVYQPVLENFLVNAEDTYYKYVENNIYGNRKQELPTVDQIEIEKVEKSEYAITEGETDPEAYFVSVTWSYKGSNYDDYQKKATLVFIHNDVRLDLVELQ